MWFLAAIAAAKGIADTVGGIKRAHAQKELGEYNYNMAEADAKESLMIGAEEERRARVMGRKFMGEQRATIGASGIQLDASALDVMQETAANVEMDAQTIKYDAYRKAENFHRQAQNYLRGGGNASQSEMWGAAGSFLMGASKAYSMYGGGGGGGSGNLLSGSRTDYGGDGGGASNYA